VEGLKREFWQELAARFNRFQAQLIIQNNYLRVQRLAKEINPSRKALVRLRTKFQRLREGLQIPRAGFHPHEVDGLMAEADQLDHLLFIQRIGLSLLSSSSLFLTELSCLFPFSIFLR
jgi:hypothetical protein